MKLDKIRTGLSLGVFMGVVHIGWATLVALGLAQTLMDKIYELHFLNNPFNVMSFDLTTAVMLAVVTFIVGLVMGWLFAYIWNQLVK